MARERIDPLDELGADAAHDRAAGGAALLGGRGVLVYAFGIVANIALARLLSPRDFGVVALGGVLLVAGAQVAHGGMGAALIRRREAPERVELEAVHGAQLALATALAVAGGGVALAFGRDGAIVAVMLLSLPITTLRLPATILLERRLVYGPIALVDLVEAIAYYVWALAAVGLGFGVWGLASGFVARAVIGVVLMLRVGPGGFVRPRMSWQHVRPVISFGAQIQLNALLVVARDQTINVLVAALAGVATLGVWSLAYRVLQVPTLIVTTVARVMFPLASHSVRIGQDPRPLIERTIGVTAVALGVTVAPLAGLLPAALPAILGPEWRDVSATLLWSALALLLTAPVLASTFGYLHAMGHPRTTAAGIAAQAVVWLAVTAALLPSLDATAVGVGAVPAALAIVIVVGRRAAALSGAAIVRSLAAPMSAGIAALAVGWIVGLAGPESVGWGVVAAAVAEVTLLASLALAARGALGDTLRLVRRGLRRGAAQQPEPVPPV